jgi:hypothetical protein
MNLSSENERHIPDVKTGFTPLLFTFNLCRYALVGKPKPVRGPHVDNVHEIYAALLYMRDAGDGATGVGLDTAFRVGYHFSGLDTTFHNVIYCASKSFN